MQRTRTITSPTLLTELCSFANFTMEIVSAQELPNPLRYFHKIWYKHIALSDDEQRTRTITPPTFLLNYSPWKLCQLNNFETVLDIFMELGRNMKHYQTMCREQEP